MMYSVEAEFIDAVVAQFGPCAFLSLLSLTLILVSGI